MFLKYLLTLIIMISSWASAQDTEKLEKVIPVFGLELEFVSGINRALTGAAVYFSTVNPLTLFPSAYMAFLIPDSVNRIQGSILLSIYHDISNYKRDPDDLYYFVLKGKKIIYPNLDKWWFEITYDPVVIEIKSKPTTNEFFKTHSKMIQKDIYKTLRLAGLFTRKIFGMGHINIGVEGLFDTDPLLFRNFIVDYVNHSELYTGVLYYDDFRGVNGGKPLVYQKNLGTHSKTFLKNLTENTKTILKKPLSFSEKD
ncbi:MAG: hypothetical protein H6621_04220 [Halobacteriovoraceae bacterium]|nr:hypothetical protein [Halobacteriovoraceae bacterium]